MGKGLFIAALVLLLARADGVRRDAAGLTSVIMEDCEGTHHPLSKGTTASFHDSMDASKDKFSSQGDVPPDFFCHSCQKVSKKAEKFLTDPSLYDEVDTLSSEVCHLLRSDLHVKCRKIVELYLREGILFLQILFLEKNLCNSTGFCPVDNTTSSLSTSSSDKEVTASVISDFVLARKREKRSPAMGLPSLNRILNLPPFKVIERRRCDTCHVATEQIRKGLEDHEQQLKVIKSLLDACELVQTYADRCKRWVFQYGPLGLANLQKFLSSTDFCHLIHMCEEPVPPKGKTGGE